MIWGLGKGGMYIWCLIMYVAGVKPFVSTAAQDAFGVWGGLKSAE